ncbi:flagellin [Henriciella aquimarina]|uniref:flagellin n=1 Tax=Henriciella aquimarina TaxID=545261 RepID=UPI0009FC5285|nr:flagellin [Henriciella aquimarina]
MAQLTLPNSLLGASFSQNITELRSKIRDTSSEAVTGRYSDLTLKLSGRIGKAMMGQKALDDITSQRGLLGLREARLDLVQQSLNNVHKSAEGLSMRMLTAVGTEDDAGVTQTARESKSALDSIFSSLNVRYGERYLFSGDATSSQPFPDSAGLLADVRTIALSATDVTDFETQIDDYFNSPTGGWQQSVYNGSATSSDGDAVTGIDPAITKLVSGLAVMAVSGGDDNMAILQQNPVLIQQAADRVAEGQIDLTTLRANKGVTQERITNEQNSLDVEETILTEAFNKMTARDQYEAASELRELQNGLEASYMLTARLSQMSLLNYLR